MKRILTMAVALVCLTALAQSTGINGKWTFALDTEGGPRSTDAEFSVDAGGKVSGKFGADAVAGTFKDGKLNLSFPIHSTEGGDGTLNLTGTFEGGVINGGWEFTGYNGTFKATRKE